MKYTLLFISFLFVRMVTVYSLHLQSTTLDYRITKSLLFENRHLRLYTANEKSFENIHMKKLNVKIKYSLFYNETDCR